MSNHLEDLTAEWLEYSGYFVRKSVLVGKRLKGGFDEELDVVGFNPVTQHLIHIECSLDTLSWDKREERFTNKFERGRLHVPSLFSGMPVEDTLDQVALLQFGGGMRKMLGGGRIVWVADLIADMMANLEKKSPDKEAVPSTLSLLRTMQLAAQQRKNRKLPGTLVPFISP